MKQTSVSAAVLAVTTAVLVAGCGQTDSTQQTSAGESDKPSSGPGAGESATPKKKTGRKLPQTRLAKAYQPCMRELNAYVGDDTPTSGTKYMKISPDGRTVRIATPGPGRYHSGTAAAVTACMLRRTDAPAPLKQAWANEKTRAGSRDETWSGVSVTWKTTGERFEVVLKEKGRA